MGKERVEELNEVYVDELIAACLKNKKALSVIMDHMQDQWLPTDEHQKVFRAIRTYWTVHQKPISIGLLMQKFEDDDDVIDLLSDVREIDIEEPDAILEELEEFIKDSLFTEMAKLLTEQWNKGDKKKAIATTKKFSDKIHNFSLKAKAFSRVFGDFEHRTLTAKVNRSSVVEGETELKPQFGIDCLDNLAQGLRRGDLISYLAPSGVGKSTMLRWNGVYNARLGFNVLHVQLEGSEDEVKFAYDSTWTKIHSSTLESGLMTGEQLEKLTDHAKKISGEVYVRAFEKFGSASTVDVRQAILDIIKSHNICPDVVLIDYLELLDPSGKRQWRPDDERHRRAAIADELKNIAVEFNCVVITATQATVIKEEQLNDPEFKLTRYHVSEAKGIIKPLTWFITLNQTKDEDEEEKIRLYVDKSRFTKAKQLFPIYQKRNEGRFYDRKRTMNMLSMAA